MAETSITLRILKKDIPLTVNSPEEEAAVRVAADEVDRRIGEYKKRFAVGDDLYLVLMCCLELATERTQTTLAHEDFLRRTNQRLAELEQIVTHAADAHA
jgi:cell division protein ZapA (FtsZ GTPase activity inhibitor)